MVQVKVEQGVLEGEELDLVTGDGSYLSFKGVPYAAPPVGKLRFKAPQPSAPWSGVKEAKAHGPVCPQRDIFTNQEVTNTNEDCLYLNVYTKHLHPETPLPVMVFIHGGAFKFGSGNEDVYGPDFLVNHGVVLVTINYRLEVFGFLSLDTEDVPGNAGMKDQVEALRWIQKNIGKFGGDPNNVTIFGESAGGASVGLHVMSPMSKDLFKRAIVMSGAPLCDWSLAFQPKRRAFVLGKQLGCETDDPQELLEFLQSVPADKLVDVCTPVAGIEETTGNKINFYFYAPVVEKDLGQEHFLTENYVQMLKNEWNVNQVKRNVNQVDVMTGYTSDEMLLVAMTFEHTLQQHNRWAEMSVPRNMLLNVSPAKALEVSDMIRKHYFGKTTLDKTMTQPFIRFTSDMTIVYGVIKFSQLLPQTGKRYFYKFSCKSGRNIHSNPARQLGLSGTGHMDDMAYLFDPKKAGLTICKDSEDYRLVQTFCTLITNFAKYGNPTPDDTLGVTWPEYSHVHEYMDIGNQLTVHRSPEADSVDFWDRAYEFAGIDVCGVTLNG